MYHISPILAGVPVVYAPRNILETISQAEFKRPYPRMTWDSKGLKRLEYDLMLDISMTVLEAVTFAPDNTRTENNIMMFLRSKHRKSITEEQYNSIRLYLRRELFE
jgi:hypothetical protein